MSRCCKQRSFVRTGLQSLLAIGVLFGVTGCSLLTTQSTLTTTVTGPGPSPISPTNRPGPVGGRVHGGQQPISGANIQLWAAGASGYGSAPTSLMTTTVTSGTNGSFTIPAGGYNACTTGQVVYVTATGGNPGVSGNNNAIVLAAVLGPCSIFGTYTALEIDEVTTVAAAFALSNFYGGFGGTPNGTTPIGGFGATSTNTTGITNAANTALNLANTQTGMTTAVEASPPSNGTFTISPPTGADSSVTGTTVTATVETEKLYTIADIIASCVNSTGPSSTQCTTLFADVAPPGTANDMLPTDVLQAAVYMATNPTSNTNSVTNNSTANITALFDLTTPQGNPYIGYAIPSTAPIDWTIGIQYSSSSTLPSPNTSYYLMDTVNYVAIDAGGDVWVSSENTAGIKPNSITELSPVGAPLVSQSGTATSLLTPTNMAIDTLGHVWLGDKDESAGGVIYEYQPGATNGNGYPSLGTLVTHVTNQSPAVVVTNGGSGYTSAPTATFSGGGCSTEPNAYVAETGGAVTGVSITSGTGYTSGTTTVTLTGGGVATESTVTATVTGGGVTSFTLGGVNSTNIYTSLPTVTITSSGSGTGAIGIPEINGTSAGNLKDIIAVSGAGCTYFPTVALIGVGTSATAKVVGLYNGGLVNSTYNSNPIALAIDGSNNVFFADNGNTGYIARGQINMVSEFPASSCSSSSCTYPTEPTSLISTPLGGTTVTVQPYFMAVDPYGTLWVGGNVSGSTALYELTTANVASTSQASTVTAVTVGKAPYGVAIDSGNNVWTANNGSSGPTTVSKVPVSNSPTIGAAGSPNNSITGGEISGPDYLTIDGAGNVWVVDGTKAWVTEYNNAGTALSPGLSSGGFAHVGLSGSKGIATDSAGNVWIANSGDSLPGGVEEIVGAAVPVVTPLSVGVKNSTLGTEP